MNSPKSIAPFLFVGLLAVVGCANEPDRTPTESAFSNSARTIEQSVEDAADEASDLDSYQLAIRYNEPHCGAPGFEILVFGRWTRVFLEGREPLLNELEDALVGDDPDVGVRSAMAYGSLVGSRETQQGLEFPVFEVERYEPVSPPEASEDGPG